MKVSRYVYFCRFNLSPRGDGNPPCVVAASAGILIQLIPARGRKPGIKTVIYPRFNLSPRGDGNCNFVLLNLVRKDSTYPREGTETAIRAKRFSFRGRDSTYPREGTETYLATASSISYTDSTYPREGTETYTPCRGRFLLCRFNLSPRGDGNSIHHAAEVMPPRIQLIPASGTKSHIINSPFLFA